MTLTLSGWSESEGRTGVADSIQVSFEPYDTAPFAMGESGDIYISVDDAILREIRQEYRDQFTKAET